jgi:hypothetical protein
MFVRGPALAGPAPGAVYVIEFSGKTFAPRLKSIPHLMADVGLILCD